MRVTRKAHNNNNNNNKGHSTHGRVLENETTDSLLHLWWRALCKNASRSLDPPSFRSFSFQQQFCVSCRRTFFFFVFRHAPTYDTTTTTHIVAAAAAVAENREEIKKT
jgi:hypothetical protein